MARKASLNTLMRRRLTARDLPIIVKRKRWADWLVLVLTPILVALGGGFSWAAVAVPDVAWLARLLLGTMGFLFSLGIVFAIDTLFGYTVIIDGDGITLKGRLGTRLIVWSEITRFGTWRIRAVMDGPDLTLGFQAVIHVDGSNNPKRLLRNLFFSGHFVAPFMDIGGKELVRLMAKAHRQIGNGEGVVAGTHRASSFDLDRLIG